MLKGVDPLDAEARSRLMARIRWRGNPSTEGAMLGLLKAGGINGWRRHVVIQVHEVVSGRKRRHTSLRGLSPTQFELKNN